MSRTDFWETDFRLLISESSDPISENVIQIENSVDTNIKRNLLMIKTIFWKTYPGPFPGLAIKSLDKIDRGFSTIMSYH